MEELKTLIPDARVLLSLEPEELGSKLLFLARRRSFQSGMFDPRNLIRELWNPSTDRNKPSPYGMADRSEIELALAEAWAWLEAQGLIVAPPDSNGQSGWRVLSRRAKRFENEGEFARFSAARMLPKEVLHARIAEKVWLAFMRGDFDTAVFQAVKMVEVIVREAASLPAELTGMALMRKAFQPDTGPLTDKSAEQGERDATSALFAGIVGFYKNPQSHREVNLDDASEVIGTILMANNLLRIVEARKV